MKKYIFVIVSFLLSFGVTVSALAANTTIINKYGSSIADIINYANNYTNTAGSSANGPDIVITQHTGVAGKAEDDISILSTVPAINNDDYSAGSSHKQWLELSYTKSEVGDKYMVVELNILPLNEETVREVLLQNGKSVSYTPAVHQYSDNCFNIGQWNNIRIVMQPSEGIAASKYPYSYIYVNGSLIAEGRSTATSYGTANTYVYPYRVMFDAKKLNDKTDSSIYYDDFSVSLCDSNPGAQPMPDIKSAEGYTVDSGTITTDGTVTVAELVSDYTLRVFADNTYDTELDENECLSTGNVIVAYNGNYITTYSTVSAVPEKGFFVTEPEITELDNNMVCTTKISAYEDVDRDIMFIAAAYKDGNMIDVSLEKRTVSNSTVKLSTSLKKAQGATYTCYVWSDKNLTPYCEETTKNFESLDGKKIIFVGNSLIYYGQTVLNKSSLAQSVRNNDTGYFYQLCKANGHNVSVTNWTFGGHKLTDSLGESCSQESKDCYGHNHLADLIDREFDYVVLSSGSWEDGASFEETIEYVCNIFRQHNPDVRFIYAGHHRNHTLGKADVLNHMKILSQNGFLVYDWGELIMDIINGKTHVPGAECEYNQNSFIISKSSADGYHPNLLTGYITTLMTYCAVTGESAVGQPYSFCNDSGINKLFDFEGFKESYYSYDNTSTDTDERSTNFDEIFASEADISGLQQLVDIYLNECHWKTYNFTESE